MICTLLYKWRLAHALTLSLSLSLSHTHTHILALQHLDTNELGNISTTFVFQSKCAVSGESMQRGGGAQSTPQSLSLTHHMSSGYNDGWVEKDTIICILQYT